MRFIIEYNDEVYKDIKKLKFTKSQLTKLKKKIENISCNPYPKNQGGLGEPLRSNLKGLMKFRFDNDYRVVYRLVEENGIMRIVVIGLRADSFVYRMANKRI